MALNLCAEIEIQSVWTSPNFLKESKTVLIEIAILGQKFFTNVQRTPLPLLFNQKFTLKKEFDQNITFCSLADLLKDSMVQVSLMEVRLTRGCKGNKFKCVCCSRIQLSAFLFPPAHVNKYQSAQLFPHKKYKPVLKFWVDAVIYRSSAQSLLSKLPELKNRKLLDSLKLKNWAMDSEDKTNSVPCIVCKTFQKYMGKPYCGHNHKQLKESPRKSLSSHSIGKDSSCDEEEGTCSGACVSGDNMDGDDKCGETENEEDDGICAEIIKTECTKKTPKDTKKSLKKSVDFWLNQMHFLSFKPADEFTNLMRTIYSKQYSHALLKYNAHCCRKSRALLVVSDPCHHSA